MSQLTKLHVQQRGQQGPAIILLHGWGFQHQVWDALSQQLSRHCRVFQVDIPGYGKSPSLDEYSLDRLSEVLAYSLPTGIWVGWSMGGLLALNTAIQAPEKVQALGLVATSPCFVQQADWPHAMKAHLWTRFAEQLQIDWRATLQRFLALQLKDGEQSREILRDLRQTFAQQAVPELEVLEHGLELLQSTDLREQITQIQCPAHVFLGERDALVPVSIAQAWQTLWPANYALDIHVYPRAAHMPFASHLPEFYAHIQQLVKNYSA